MTQLTRVIKKMAIFFCYQAKMYSKWSQVFQAPARHRTSVSPFFHRVRLIHNGFIRGICCPQNQPVAEFMCCAITVLQSVSWSWWVQCVKAIQGWEASTEEGMGELLSYSQGGSEQTISGIRLPRAVHMIGMRQPWPTSPHWETIYGPCDWKRTCIKQGCALGVSV